MKVAGMFKFFFTLIEDLLRSDAEVEELTEHVDERFFNYQTGEAIDLPTAGGIYDVDVIDEKSIDDLRG